jgi:hypothetical protein
MEPEESVDLNYKAFRSVARYLSPKTLQQLNQVNPKVTEKILEVENDPMYWIKQLTLLSGINFNLNSRQ